MIMALSYNIITFKRCYKERRNGGIGDIQIYKDAKAKELSGKIKVT